jgi:ribosome-associated toxin RatA of RatAB toxin-antitoxin module
VIARFFVAALIASELCAVALSAEPEASPGEWKFLSNKEGVTIYRRQRTRSNESKAVGDIAASTDVIHALLEDVNSHPSFMPYMAECRVLKREGDSLIAYQRISAPMVSDRDYTIRVRTTVKKSEGGTAYSSHWVTDNAAGPPEKRGVVRVNLCEGSWLLEPAGPNSTHATYQIYSDSGGYIPSFIKNTAGPAGIRKLFAAIRKQVRDPKYAKKN